jgi:hypothetical protein
VPGPGVTPPRSRGSVDPTGSGNTTPVTRGDAPERVRRVHIWFFTKDSMREVTLVYRLAYNGDVVAFKMGRRLGKRVGGSAYWRIGVSASGEVRLFFDMAIMIRRSRWS